MAEGDEDRTEAATPRRRQRAREQGNVPLSREAAPAAMLSGGLLVLMLVVPRQSAALARSLSVLLERAQAIDPLAGLRAAAFAAMPLVLSFACATIVAAAAAVLAQTGFNLRPTALQPSLERLDPRRNLGRIAGLAALAELARSLLKLGVIGFAIWHAASALLAWLAPSLVWTPAHLLDQSFRLVLRLLLAAVGAQALVAVADVIRARWSHARSLRMSRQDIREEMRESDGDPQIKARIRRIRMTRARRRMLQAVPKAAVVVTNPTHYAVALAYERGAAGAPRVIAKGVDAMATRIREVARESRVPLVANPPLARALWRVELDSEIPAVLFQAVAEIIAYVWRLRTPARRL